MFIQNQPLAEGEEGLECGEGRGSEDRGGRRLLWGPKPELTGRASKVWNV